MRWQCAALGVSVSGYYAWKTRPESARSRANRALTAQITAIYEQSDQTYGSPRVHAELQARNQACGRHRVARLMRQTGLKTRVQRLRERARRGRTFEHVSSNKLERAFWAERANQRWVSDVTQIPTAEGWLYLAAIMDLYSRAVIGWSMSGQLTQALTLDALHMALGQRGKVDGLLLHSDQGVHYRTAQYHALATAHGIECSMSRPGNCLDNAAMESFFHSLKTERVHHERYRTRDEARQRVFDYIERFYNRQRRHSYLAYHAPLEYERLHAVS